MRMRLFFEDWAYGVAVALFAANCRVDLFIAFIKEETPTVRGGGRSTQPTGIPTFRKPAISIFVLASAGKWKIQFGFAFCIVCFGICKSCGCE